MVATHGVIRGLFPQQPQAPPTREVDTAGISHQPGSPSQQHRAGLVRIALVCVY